jgi:hypothetical protein
MPQTSQPPTTTTTKAPTPTHPCQAPPSTPAQLCPDGLPGLDAPTRHPEARTCTLAAKQRQQWQQGHRDTTVRHMLGSACCGYDTPDSRLITHTHTAGPRWHHTLVTGTTALMPFITRTPRVEPLAPSHPPAVTDVRARSEAEPTPLW